MNKLSLQQLKSIQIKLDTGVPDDWFPVFIADRTLKVYRQFFDERDNADRGSELRIELNGVHHKLTEEQLLSIEIELTPHDWYPVFIKSRVGIYGQFFDGADVNDCNKNLRIEGFDKYL